MNQYVIFTMIYLFTVYYLYFLTIFILLIRRIRRNGRLKINVEQRKKIKWIKNYLEEEFKVKKLKFKLVESSRTFAAMSGFLPYPLLFVSTSLLESFNKKEFKYILSHEYAHYQRKHSIKQFLFMFCVILIGFMSVWVDVTLGIRTNLYGWRFHIYPLLNGIILGVLTLIYFRFHEFEADDFALAKVGKDSMISVTKKLKKKSKFKNFNISSIPYNSRLKLANEQFPCNKLKILKILWTIILLFFTYFWVIPFIIMKKEISEVYYQAEEVPEHNVAIVLGAGVKPDGTPSDILKDRLIVAAKLYEKNKVNKILVSGDNRWHHYNEPKVMKEYLVTELGVLEGNVLEDFAGRRTYDTCIRSKELWNVNRAILVTQEFHLYRSLYVCEELGIDVVGVSATRHIYVGEIYFKSREILAIHKSVLDLSVKRPRYIGGDKEVDLSE